MKDFNVFGDREVMPFELATSIQRVSPDPLLFATLGGSRAFGCASPTSDFDIHGVHLLSLPTVLGLGEQAAPAWLAKRTVPPWYNSVGKWSLPDTSYWGRNWRRMMSHRKAWPTEQDKTILQMIHQGMHDAAIAREMGVHPSYVSQKVRKMKLRADVERQDLTIELLERCMVYRALKLAIERRGILIRQWIAEAERVCMILLLADRSMAWEVSLEELRILKDLGTWLDANLIRLTDGQRFVCCKKCAMPLLLSVKCVDEEQQCEKWRGYRAVQAGPQSELITRCPGCRTLLYAGEGKDSFYVERVQEISE